MDEMPGHYRGIVQHLTDGGANCPTDAIAFLIVEFVDIIEPLAHPERFGGDPADAFDVVAPSLPGFAFSGRPPRPYGPRRIAALWAKLIIEKLGYPSYMAQGGDWGSAVST